MKKRIVLILALTCVLDLVSCSQNEGKSPEIQYPYVQEYVAGQGNIKGSVPIEEYTSISEDFAIGANKNGYAVFKDPEKALAKLLELYSEGIKLIQTAYDLDSLSADNYSDYKIYGSQITTGTKEEQQQAIFVGKFLDIYENSYIKQ